MSDRSIKIVLAVILAVVCLGSVCAGLGYSNCEQDKDPIICDLEKSISRQEKLLSSLRDKYEKLIIRKKQLLEWIDQEKQKLEEKESRPAQQKVEKKQEEPPALFKKSDSFRPEKKTPDKRDINYLDLLIKKQKELCAAISQLEINIAAEEKELKKLKETQKLLLNP